MQDMVLVCHSVCEYVGGPKNWERWSPPLVTEAWLTPKTQSCRTYLNVPNFVAAGQAISE